MHGFQRTLGLAAAVTLSACAPPTVAPSAPASVPPASMATPAWTRADLPIAVEGVFGGNLPADVVRFADQLIAVGAVNGGCCDGSFDPVTRALVWASSDGLAWTLAPEAESLQLGRMLGVATNGRHLVAIGIVDRPRAGHPGEKIPVAATWTSADGVTWQRSPDAPEFGSIAGSAAGFVAAPGGGTAPEAWWSETGEDWEQVATTTAMGAGTIDRLVHTSTGFVAVGGSDGVAAVWTSADGRTWDRVADQAAFAGGRMLDVAEREGRFVAVGEGPEGESALIWLSEDARTWRRLELLDGGANDLRLTRVIATEAGFLAIATYYGDVGREIRVFASADGTDWQAADPASGLGDAELHLAAWTAFGDGVVVAVGDRWDRELGAVPVTWLIR